MSNEKEKDGIISKQLFGEDLESDEIGGMQIYNELKNKFEEIPELKEMFAGMEQDELKHLINVRNIECLVKSLNKEFDTEIKSIEDLIKIYKIDPQFVLGELELCNLRRMK